MTKKPKAKQTAEIVPFPNCAKDGSTQDPQEMMSNILSMRIVACEDALQFISQPLFESLWMAGFSTNDEYLNEILIAVLRAIAHEHFHLANPFVEFLYKNKKKLDVLLSDQLTLDDVGDVS